MDENNIVINKYVCFSKENGTFFLTSQATEMIYRQKGLICSYSGSHEWIHHFVCEMIDFCSGASIYNYALGTVKHETEIPKIFKENKEAVIRFIEKTLEKPWGKKMYELIERIIEESASVND
jgi:hypothetical protein